MGKALRRLNSDSVPVKAADLELEGENRCEFLDL